MIDDLQKSLLEKGSVSFFVRARPGASRTAMKAILDDGTLKIDIAAVPEEGKANAALRKFLAEEFQVSVSQVEILSGDTGRKKLVRITTR